MRFACPRGRVRLSELYSGVLRLSSQARLGLSRARGLDGARVARVVLAGRLVVDFKFAHPR